VLSPQSALKVLDGDSRQVELLKGQAYFQVAPDPQHPFIARAGQLSVRVLGTAFDLDLQHDVAEVALEHGQVQAENTQPPLSERLMPGQRLKFSWPSGKVERTSLAPTQVAAWRSGSLFIENQSVAEIVDHLQRYTSGWIVITDPALKARRITGVYDLSDPSRALKALAQSLGVNTRQMTPWVHTLGNF
jgi:transmembrane sensor